MQVKVTKKDHYWILKCEGDTVGLEPGPFPEVRKALNEGAHEIILEFGTLGFLSAIGVKSLQETLKLVRERGAHLGISAPQRKVRRALKLSGLSREIPVYFNLMEAVTKLDMIDYQPESLQESVDTLLICQKSLPVAGELRSAIASHPLNAQFRMKPVRDFKTAEEILLKERIDCILIDSTFAVFQVAGFVERVRIDERIPNIPMLVVTEDDRIDEAEMMIRHGVHEMLRSPMVPTETVVRLQTIISHLKDHRPFYPPGSVTQPRGYKA